MAYQTLYRKYRPNNFDLIYGQDAIVKTLKNVIKNDKLSHAYLFTGPRGTGKTSSAKLFAKTINCINNNSGNACNNCEICKAFNNNSNPDIIEIDAASNNGVDEIREIRNKVNLVPGMSKYKVYIIDEVHMLSIGAFNALLKTLEEPPKHIIFILATTEPQKIPETIISRCQRFDFKNISFDNMKKCLKNIIDKENINIEENALDEIIISSKGGMRDAIGMLDQAFAFCENKITKEDVESLLGTISDDMTIHFINDILNNSIQKVLEFSNKISNEGKDYELIILKILDMLKNSLIDIKLGGQAKINCKDTDIVKLLESFENIYERIPNSNDKKIIFDIGILKMLKNINILKNDEIKEKTPVENLNNNTTLNENTDVNEIKVTNILVRAEKETLNEVKNKWQGIKNYILDKKYKLAAGILIDSKPVAASKEGILITCKSESDKKRIYSNIFDCEVLLEILFDKKYELTVITEEYWTVQRPIYAKKVKNKEIKYIEISKDNVSRETLNKDMFNEFNEFVEMED